MLLRFGVFNFRSIHAYQSISLVASALKDSPEQLIESGTGRERVLPLLGLYGGNAAGKSNLLKAIYMFRSLILHSQTKGEPGGGVPREPFLLDPESEKPSSRSQYDCDFVLKGVRYHFGVATDSERVLEEWLYAYPEGHRQVWYHRNVSESPVFHFGKFLKGRNRAIESLTRTNSLFLSAAAQNNHEQLGAIYEFFRDQLKFPGVSEAGKALLRGNPIEDVSIRAQVLEFLRQADTGISGIRIHEEELPEPLSEFAIEFRSLMKTHVPDLPESVLQSVEHPRKLQLAHQAADGREVLLELETESLGTRALLGMLGPVFTALRDGTTLFIDELTTSVHTLLAKALLQLFVSPKTNHRGAQLIFTTHDTNLLSAGVLRRDSIWFAEKDQVGATTLFPLTDIETRNKDNLERGYLEGRFGAIPFVGNMAALLGEGGCP